MLTTHSMPHWTVESLLKWVATAQPRLDALIDVGALVTGLSNEEVARYLLKEGLEGKDAVVFLDAMTVSKAPYEPSSLVHIDSLADSIWLCTCHATRTKSSWSSETPRSLL